MSTNEVAFLSDIWATEPIYHLVPRWWSPIREGWTGESLLCNEYVHAGTNTPFGTNNGALLPEYVVAPCGAIVLHREPIHAHRQPAFTRGIDVLNATRMHERGVHLPEKHASTFGRICKTCESIAKKASQ